MTKSENTPLNKNELDIVRLTVEGHSQKSIAEKVGLSASNVCRILKKPRVIEKLQASTQELHYPIYQKMSLYIYIYIKHPIIYAKYIQYYIIPGPYLHPYT